MICIVLAIYFVGAMATYIATSIMIRNPNDDERDYGSPPEWDFDHIGAAIVFPLFWAMWLAWLLGSICSKTSQRIYDSVHKESD